MKSTFLCLLVGMKVMSASVAEGSPTLDPNSQTEEPSVYYLPLGESVVEQDRTFLQEPALSMELPLGWSVNHNPNSGITLFAKGAEEKIKKNRDTFKIHRTLSVRTLYKSEPIDQVREKTFLEELNKYFTERAPVQEFQILEHQKIDFRGKEDALLVYSTYSSSGLQMIQMHFLVASKDAQYVVTYTDADELYRADSARHDLAWNTVASIDFDGSPTWRYQDEALYAGIFLGLCFLLLLVRSVRKLRQRRLLKSFDGEMEDDLSFVTDMSHISQNMNDEKMDDVDEDALLGLDDDIDSNEEMEIALESGDEKVDGFSAESKKMTETAQGKLQKKVVHSTKKSLASEISCDSDDFITDEEDVSAHSALFEGEDFDLDLDLDEEVSEIDEPSTKSRKKGRGGKRGRGGRKLAFWKSADEGSDDDDLDAVILEGDDEEYLSDSQAWDVKPNGSAYEDEDWAI